MATEASREGMLVALEGIDGAGKSTAAVQARASLQERGVDTEMFTPFSEAQIELDAFVDWYVASFEQLGDKERLPEEEDQLLHAALTLSVARKRLEAYRALHEVVLVDRYVTSRIVLARMAMPVLSEETGPRRPATAETLVWQNLSTGVVPRPDLTIHLATDADTARRRIEARGGRPEARDNRTSLIRAAELYDEVTHMEHGGLLGEVVQIDTTEYSVQDVAQLVTELVVERIHEPLPDHEV